MAYEPNRLREGRQIELPEALNLARDRVRWGPIWAGLFTALTTLIILSLLGVAIGLTAVDPRAAAQGNPPQGIGIGAAIWEPSPRLSRSCSAAGWPAGRRPSSTANGAP